MKNLFFSGLASLLITSGILIPNVCQGSTASNQLAFVSEKPTSANFHSDIDGLTSWTFLDCYFNYSDLQALNYHGYGMWIFDNDHYFYNFLTNTSGYTDHSYVNWWLNSANKINSEKGFSLQDLHYIIFGTTPAEYTFYTGQHAKNPDGYDGSFSWGDFSLSGLYFHVLDALKAKTGLHLAFISTDINSMYLTKIVIGAHYVVGPQ